MCVTNVINSVLILKITYFDLAGRVKEVTCPPIYETLKCSSTTKEKVIQTIFETIGYDFIQVLEISKEYKQLGGYI